jgi:GNAT superfamily N-acetyltransferase
MLSEICGSTVRPAEASDLTNVAALLTAYVRETYAAVWHGTTAALERDALGRHCQLVVAARAPALLGFAASRPTYDLHHCMVGVEVLDLYVVPSARGAALAVRLLAAVAARAAGDGAQFLTGGAVEHGAVQRLYARGAVRHGNQFYVSGRGFRALAAVTARHPREIMRQLPRPEWSLEA